MGQGSEDPELPAHRLWQPTTAKWFFAIFGFSLVYAIVRYHFAGDVAWRHFPLFILNKATSLAAVCFLAAVHAFFSPCMLSPAYYGKYFDDVGRPVFWHADDVG